MLYYITVQASSGIQKETLNKAAKPYCLIATRSRIVSKKKERRIYENCTKELRISPAFNYNGLITFGKTPESTA